MDRIRCRCDIYLSELTGRLEDVLPTLDGRIVVMSHEITEDDWRLQSGRGLVEGRTFTWMRWRGPRPEWDHDHCALCGQKLAQFDWPDVQKEGYADEEEYHWLCGSCGTDFRDILHLTLIGGPDAT